MPRLEVEPRSNEDFAARALGIDSFRVGNPTSANESVCIHDYWTLLVTPSWDIPGFLAVVRKSVGLGPSVAAAAFHTGGDIYATSLLADPVRDWVDLYSQALPEPSRDDLALDGTTFRLCFETSTNSGVVEFSTPSSRSPLYPLERGAFAIASSLSSASKNRVLIQFTKQW